MFVDVSAVLFDKINMAKTFPELKYASIIYIHVRLLTFSIGMFC